MNQFFEAHGFALKNGHKHGAIEDRQKDLIEFLQTPKLFEPPPRQPHGAPEEEGELSVQTTPAAPPRQPHGAPEEEGELSVAVTEVISPYCLKLGGKPLDFRTVRTICSYLAHLSNHPAQVKAVLDVVQEKCRHLARNPEEANQRTWGWIVGVVRSEVNQRLEQKRFDPLGYNAGDRKAYLRDMIANFPNHHQAPVFRADLEVLERT